MKIMLKSGSRAILWVGLHGHPQSLKCIVRHMAMKLGFPSLKRPVLRAPTCMEGADTRLFGLPRPKSHGRPGGCKIELV